MKWLRSSLEGAGLQRVRPIDFFLSLCFISAILGLVISAISGVAPGSKCWQLEPECEGAS
ncbi:MAG: hypothetical protein RL716_1190 [Actinomycetota bacterium]